MLPGTLSAAGIVLNAGNAQNGPNAPILSTTKGPGEAVPITPI
jgi:hypothetical protein